jgi:hypothetical protein
MQGMRSPGRVVSPSQTLTAVQQPSVLAPWNIAGQYCQTGLCPGIIRPILDFVSVRTIKGRSNLVDKDCEFKPAGSLCRWAFPKTGAPTLLLCSISDYPRIHRPCEGCYPPHPCTHWAFGIVLYEKARRISNTKEQLPHEWRAWKDHNLRNQTISRLGAQYPSGHVYRIRKRLLFPAPVSVRVTQRNYGDGWIRSQDIELRTAIQPPSWTGWPLLVRKVLAKDRPRARP